MRHPRPSALVLSLLLTTASLAAPPRVLSSTVEDGQDDADPALTEFRFTFDQPMSPNSWSIVGGGPQFPKLTAKPRWADATTLILPVALEPDHEYWLSLNSDTFTGFQNPAGQPALPQPLSFHTRPANPTSSPPLTAAQKQAAIATLRKAIDEDYSYRDRLHLDWDKLFSAATPKLEAAQTANQFARATAALLRPASDAHIYVRAGQRAIYTAVNATPPNFGIPVLRLAVPDLKDRGRAVAAGHVNDDVGYLLITEWNAANNADLDAAFATVRTSKSLVIDVRPNGGGDEVAAQHFAARFVSAPKVYSRNLNRLAGKWTGPFDRALQPAPLPDRYDGRVALLIGPKVMSSCESFAQMMRQDPNCQLVGAPTRGSSGNPKPHNLGLGVTVILPSWKDLLPDGSDLEGIGITPDVEVKTTPQDFKDSDPVLTAALKALR